MRTHTPQQQFKEAKQIASDHNMFVVDKGDTFFLYRKASPKPAFLGKRSSAEGIRTLVCRCANFK